MSDPVICLPFDVTPVPVDELKAGEITCWYENGNIRYISIAGEEVVRMIYPAVRSTTWATADYQINHEKKEILDESFKISYTAIYRLGVIRYKARISIIGRVDSSITFAMKGEALSKFESNRIGLCVHHPIESCSGKKVTITRQDQSIYNAFFPVHISPHQPFTGIQQMFWNTVQDHSIHLKFKGDVFETEDQRNWGDNNYKTYGTPLDRPSPILLEVGSGMEQQIDLRIIKSVALRNTRTPVKIKIKEEKNPFPKIGYCRLAGTGPLTTYEITALKKLTFDHYRIELNMASGKWRDELEISLSEAGKLDTTLELIVFFSDSFEAESEQLIVELEKHAKIIGSLLPLHVDKDATPDYLIQSLYSRYKKAIPGIEIGYGTVGSFAELNRNRPADIEFDFVSFSMNPQVHANDTRSIAENLESQQKAIVSIRQFTSRPVYVSPITFQQKADSSGDQRLHAYFGAAWTLISLKNFSKAAHLTFYQTTGENGLVCKSESTNNKASKLYDVLVQLKEFQPFYVIMEGNKDAIIFENRSGKRLTYLFKTAF